MSTCLLEMQRPYRFISPFGARQFVAWVIAEDVALSREEMYQISLGLVEAGCRFAACSGIECSIWDDAIDYAAMEIFPDTEHGEGPLVMTTWHDGQSMEEIADLIANWTSFEDFVSEHFLVVSVGGDSDQGALDSLNRALAGKSN